MDNFIALQYEARMQYSLQFYKGKVMWSKKEPITSHFNQIDDNKYRSRVEM